MKTIDTPRIPALAAEGYPSPFAVGRSRLYILAALAGLEEATPCAEVARALAGAGLLLQLPHVWEGLRRLRRLGLVERAWRDGTRPVYAITARGRATLEEFRAHVRALEALEDGL